MKGHGLFKREINTKCKNGMRSFKNLASRTTEPEKFKYI
jgi:hypothetical protein